MGQIWCLGSATHACIAHHDTYDMPYVVIVKASSGPRYVVGCRTKVDKEKLIQGTRVALDMTTLTIMRALPREVRGLAWPSRQSYAMPALDKPCNPLQL